MSLKLGHITAVSTPEIKLLHKIFKDNSYNIKIAGGAVRDIILNKNPDDIDFATDALPDQMVDMFTKAEIRMLNKNGLSHGTVTVRINDKENYEITTLRIDRNPDGRHCEVEFTKDWLKDAERRDLTINALFLELHFPEEDEDAETTGTLFDYFDGQKDLLEKRIRFVNDPASRIDEDYLRILRYFRFYCRFTDYEKAHLHDEKVIDIIHERAEKLSTISGERLWVELRKIMSYKTSAKVLPVMHKCGVLRQLGIDHEVNESLFTSLVESDFFESKPEPATILSLMARDSSSAQSVRDRMKISNYDFNILDYLITQREMLKELFITRNSGHIIKHFQGFVILSTDSKRMIAASNEAIKLYSCDKEQRDQLLATWTQWTIPKFPTNGKQVLQAWPDVSSRQLSGILNHLKTLWVQSDFTMTEDDLLEMFIYKDLVEQKIIVPSENGSPKMKKKKTCCNAKEE